MSWDGAVEEKILEFCKTASWHTQYRRSRKAGCRNILRNNSEHEFTVKCHTDEVNDREEYCVWNLRRFPTEKPCGGGDDEHI